jgi:opacity protein-like surface antigen
MTKKLFAAAALVAVLATPAIAADTPAEHSFQRDGETYVYTTVLKADRVILSGRRYPMGGAFELTVRGDHITGVSNGYPVSFTVPGAQAKITPPAQLAAR